MIQVEYIVDDNKSLLTIVLNNYAMKRLRVKCNDYLNLFQSSYNLNCLTIFKADTGYRITRVKRRKKMYQIIVKHRLESIKEFGISTCTYFIKKNGFIKIMIK